MGLNIFCIGASKNIGYHAALRLLGAGHSVTFLLRHPAVFDADEAIQHHITAGTASLVKGDALVRDDVADAWGIASASRPVDLLLFSLGGTPSFSLLGGFLISPPDLCTRSLLNVLVSAPPAAHFDVVLVSGMGVDAGARANLPWAMRGLSAYALRSPQADKLGMEHVLAEAQGAAWTVEEPRAEILPPEGAWKRELGAKRGIVRGAVVVRPAMLTNGRCTGVYRTAVGDRGRGFVTVSREDVAHFIVEDVMNDWEKWEGKLVGIAY